MYQKFFFGTIVLFLLLILILPLASMVQEAFSFEVYQKLLENASLFQSFNNSLLLASTVALSTTIMGTFLGILLGKTDLKFHRLFLLLLLIPLLIPPYIFAYSWFELLGREGTLGELLFGFWGTVFILFSIYLPIPLLLTLLFLRQIPPRLEESALLMGAWREVLLKITLPLISPALGFSFLLVFLLTFGELSVANFLHYPVFPMQSFIYFSAFYDFKMATLSTLPMLLLTLLLLLLHHLLKKRKFHFKAEQKYKIFSLGKGAYLTLLFLTLFTFFTILLPIMGLLNPISLQSFLIALEKASSPLAQSLLWAGLGAIVLTFFAFLSAYIKNYQLWGWRLLESSELFLFLLPSTLVAIALVLFWNKPYSNFIYATPLILIVAYLIKYLFLSSKIIELKLIQIPPSQLESAKLLGASWFQILYSIILPLNKKSLGQAWIIGFIFSMRESNMTLLLHPAGIDTLATYTLTQMANGNEAIIASLCLIMIITMLLPLFFLGLKQ